MEKTKKQIEISAVSNGWGEQSTFIKVGDTFNKRKIVRIEKSSIFLGRGYYNDLTINCYTAYDKYDMPILTINDGFNVEVHYSETKIF